MSKSRRFDRWRDRVVTQFEVGCTAILPTGKPERTGKNLPKHRIQVTRSGRLLLLDHGEGGDDRNHRIVEEMRDHAGMLPEHTCMATLRNWRKAREAKQTRLDPGFESSAPETVKAYRYVHELKALHAARGVDLLATPAKQRWTANAVRAAQLCLQQCCYGDGFSGGAAFRVREGRNVEGCVVRVPVDTRYSKNGAEAAELLRIEVDVLLQPLRWYRRVYLEGLAVVEKHFVLDVLAAYLDGSFLVAAMRPDPATLGILLGDAVVHPRTMRIEWTRSEFFRDWMEAETREKSNGSPIITLENQAARPFGHAWQQALDKFKKQP